MSDSTSPPPPRVSVVIPSYNYAQYLPLTLHSVLTQTFPDFEILLIDDGSTDSTREVVASIPDPRLRYIRQENAGLSAARNTGIGESCASFIAFLDADDLWEPTFLEEVLLTFSTLPDSYCLVATASSRIDGNGTPIPPPKRTWERDRNREYTARDFCLRNRPLSSSIIIRREVFEKVGSFDTNLRSSEDRDLWIRATAAGFRFWFLHQSLCRIRRHSGNMSKQAPRMNANSSSVLHAARRRGAVSRGDVPFWLRAFAVHYQQVATTHFDGGYRARAIGYLALSVLHWPFFANPGAVAEPAFFRIRTAAHFLVRCLREPRA